MKNPELEARLRAALADPERTPLEGAAPVFAVSSSGTDAEWTRALNSQATLTLALERRGAQHGQFVELDAALDPRAKLPRLSKLRERFKAARPLLFTRVLAPDLSAWRNEIHALAQLPAALRAPGDLHRFAAARLALRGSGFQVGAASLELRDKERDIERIELVPTRAHAPRDLSLWVKLGRLSTHHGDASVRLRFGLGQEGRDDGTADLLALQELARAAKALLPVRGLIEARRDLFELLERVSARSVLLPSADIVYFNAPSGGALFHHDAFSTAGDAQVGVLFCQLAGRTAWLALSISDLARRVRDFSAEIETGALPWVRDWLTPTGVWSALAELKCNPTAFVRELSLPGCGRLGPLVNQGPEFTGYLADCGHAAILRPGDALLLPNHGLASTAMHSVFCASSGANAAISLALFAP